VIYVFDFKDTHPVPPVPGSFAAKRGIICTAKNPFYSVVLSQHFAKHPSCESADQTSSGIQSMALQK
jgi:hypothetical protein